jgi:hypothetical protein
MTRAEAPHPFETRRLPVAASFEKADNMFVSLNRSPDIVSIYRHDIRTMFNSPQQRDAAIFRLFQITEFLTTAFITMICNP